MNAGAHPFPFMITRDSPAIDLMQVVRHAMNRELDRPGLQGADLVDSMGNPAAGAALEIKGLLEKIRGCAELIAKSMAAVNPIISRTAMDIRKAADRTSNLASQFMNAGRGRSGEACELDLNTLIRDVEMFTKQIAGPSIELRLDLDGDLGLVRGDAVQLERVIMNLVTNSCDAMPEGGRLTVTTRNVQSGAYMSAMACSHLPAGEYVLLVVTDTGTGIPREIQKAVFLPFFTTKPRGRATGLGLSTCRGIIENLGGRICADSGPGLGTVMSVFLPRRASRGSISTEAGSCLP